MRDKYSPQEQPLQPERDASQLSDAIVISERAIGLHIQTLRQAQQEMSAQGDKEAVDAIKEEVINALVMAVSKRVGPDGTYKTKK